MERNITPREDQATEQVPVLKSGPTSEYVDRYTPDDVRKAVAEAVEQFASESQRDSWGRRRQRILHLVNVLERNLDTDIERFVH